MSTQVASFTLEESEPAIWGRLTLTTVVSSTCMTALDMTAMAVSQRCGGIAFPSGEERTKAARTRRIPGRAPGTAVAPAKRAEDELAMAARRQVPGVEQRIAGCSPGEDAGGEDDSGDARRAHSQTSAPQASGGEWRDSIAGDGKLDAA